MKNYPFHPEPSLEKVVQDELSLVGLVRAQEEVDRRIQRVWRPGTFEPICFPVEASELADDSGAPKLAIPHFEACSVEAGGTRREPLLVVTESGAPGRAFQRIADKFLDAKRKFIGTLTITCEGLPDMRALGMAVPQFPKGEYRVAQNLVAEFGQACADGSLTVRYDGVWSRYKRLRSTLEAQAGEATKVSVRNVLTASYADGLAPAPDAYQTLRGVMVQLDLGRIEVRAEECPSVAPQLSLG